MLEFLPKRNHPDDTIFLTKKDRKKLRKEIENLIREQPHLTIKEIGERSVGVRALQRYLHSKAAATLMFERQRRQLRDFFHDATHIVFDREAVRQFIGALGRQYEIPTREIARLCDMTHQRIADLYLPPPRMRFMKLHEGRALWELPERLERGEVEFSTRYLRNDDARFHLDKNQLRQFIDAMRTKFHAAISTIAKECGVDRALFYQLLTPKGPTSIKTKTAQDLWELPEHLENGNVSLDQRGYHRVIEPVEWAGRVELDKDQLHQFVNALCEKFSGLNIEDIEKLCRMDKQRLPDLLRRKKNYAVQRFIRPAEMAALWNLPERLEEGEAIFEKKVKVDKQNLRQYIDSLLDTFDGLTIKEIARMCDVSVAHLNRVHYTADFYMRNVIAQTLWDLPERIRTGEVTYTPSKYARKPSARRTKIRFEKEPVHRLVGAIAERYCLTREAVGRASGITNIRFEDIMYRRRYNLFHNEAEALWNLPKRLERGEIDIQTHLRRRGRPKKS